MILIDRLRRVTHHDTSMDALYCLPPRFAPVFARIY